MNTSASNIRPLMQSGLVERLVSEQLMSPASAAEIAEQAHYQANPERRHLGHVSASSHACHWDFSHVFAANDRDW